ncbi:MAG: excinuclease ABC subunit UvrC [Candidatus Tectomicrobia bacterium]|nr:excinuclease ABC subunit UvrC [Candidatus Tectomicrobia bacterium]
MTDLKDKIEQFPTTPGVYLMKNTSDAVIYVGKAKNLRSRVRSYFRKSGDNRYQIRFLIPNVHDIEFLVTDTEKEALILENTLIKKHKPRYNINFRDDKTYVSLELSIGDRYPKLAIVRQHERKDALYFGPYDSSQAVRETINSLLDLFPIRSCSDAVFRNRTRPCLYYQIKRCVGPCVEGLTTDKEYSELVDQVALFLQGKSDELLSTLQSQMHKESDTLNFEGAGRIYKKIQAIQRTLERQKVTSEGGIDQDIFGYYREGEAVEIERLSIRRGVLVGGKAYAFSKQILPDEELLASYLNQFYASETFIPQEIVLPFEIEGIETLEELLTERRGKRVLISVPQRGEKRQLILMANKNAEHSFRKHKDQAKVDEEILDDLQARLHLKNRPEKIECFDISNIMGNQAVGSMVKFANGKPEKKGYRHFKIKTIEGSNDYGMMMEVLGRRYRRALEENDLPDLIMVDGGKGQLNIAQAVLADLGIESPDLISIAKSRLREIEKGKGKEHTDEQIYLPGRKNPVIFHRNSSTLFLLQRIRDEAHRFGITHHRQLREKKQLRSALQDIPGIGPSKARQLLTHLGSVKRVQEASLEELAQVPGITKALAEKIFHFFHHNT